MMCCSHHQNKTTSSLVKKDVSHCTECCYKCLASHKRISLVNKQKIAFSTQVALSKFPNLKKIIVFCFERKYSFAQKGFSYIKNASVFPNRIFKFPNPPAPNLFNVKILVSSATK